MCVNSLLFWFGLKIENENNNIDKKEDLKNVHWLSDFWGEKVEPLLNG